MELLFVIFVVVVNLSLLAYFVCGASVLQVLCLLPGEVLSACRQLSLWTPGLLRATFVTGTSSQSNACVSPPRWT